MKTGMKHLPRCPYASCVRNRGNQPPRPYRCRAGIGTRQGKPCAAYRPRPDARQFPPLVQARSRR